MTVYPTYRGHYSLRLIRKWKTFRGLHPTMQQRVSDLMEASRGKVGLGEGFRPATLQLQLFLSRHVQDPDGPIRYDAKRWRRVPGKAAAVPPGRSMHELGLAADLAGDMDWLGDNAGRFDLLTFANVNNEPWHVQPVELPRGRSAYEQRPAWGMPPWDEPSGPQRPGGGSGSGSGSPDPMTTAKRIQLRPSYTVRPGDSGAGAAVMEEALIARALLDDDRTSRNRSYEGDDEDLVRGYQRSRRLHVDGIVGPQTWGVMLRVIRPDDLGADVKVLQATLIERRLLRDTAGNRDGVYGPATQEVVGQFQSAAGLLVDGVVGAVTWTALIGDRKRVAVTRGEAPEPADDDLDDVDGQAGDYDDIDMLEILEGRSA